jgi:hypothetical protein
MKALLAAAVARLANVDNEKGAEVVEWVLWVGGIAVLAGVIYAVVNSSLQAKTSDIMNLVAPVAS